MASNDAVVIEADKSGSAKVKSLKIWSSYFVNKDETKCPSTAHSLVNQNLSPYTGDVVKINDQGYIEVDEAKYAGAKIELMIKYLTAFNKPVYKPFTIQQKVDT